MSSQADGYLPFFLLSERNISDEGAQGTNDGETDLEDIVSTQLLLLAIKGNVQHHSVVEDALLKVRHKVLGFSSLKLFPSLLKAVAKS